MNKPNLFVVGAPKCGTTTLCQILKSHPDIFVPDRKEIHFFNTDGMRSCYDLQEYESNYAPASPYQRYLVDGSTHYLASEVAIKNALQYCPQAKFIVCLRNPIEMAVSLHSERVWQGMENIADFAVAWGLRKQRAGAGNVPRVMRGHEHMLDYEAMCCLGTQLARAMALVPPENITVVLLEDLRERRRAVLSDIENMLGISSGWSEGQEVLNARKSVRHLWMAILVRLLASIKRKSGLSFSTGVLKRLQSYNTRRADDQTVDDATRKCLEAAFREEIRLAETLTGRNLQHWYQSGGEA